MREREKRMRILSLFGKGSYYILGAMFAHAILYPVYDLYQKSESMVYTDKRHFTRENWKEEKKRVKEWERGER